MGLSFEYLIHWLTLMRWAERVRQLFSLMEFENANLRISSVQSLSCVQLFGTPWTAARQASLFITNSRSLPKLMSIESLMPSNHLSSVVPFSSCLQSFPASGSFLMSWLSLESSNTLATWCKELIHYKRPRCWERLKAGGEGDNRRWMIGWHHRLNGHEFEQAPGDGERQGNLACCSPWGCKESDMPELLNWSEVNVMILGGESLGGG